MAEERILLVEGEDDEHVVKALCKARKVELNFTITNKKTYPQLLDGIPVTLKQPALRVLGVLADANDDPESRWREIVDAAARSDVVLPDAPDSCGTIIQVDLRVGAGFDPGAGIGGEFACEVEVVGRDFVTWG